MPEAVIEVTGLTKRFGEVEALRGLGLRIERGWLYGLLGPNGAGKTTAVRILTGLSRPTSGEAMVLGRRAADRRLRGRLGYMPQEVALYADLTVCQNLRLFGELHGMSRADIAVREAELLELIGLVKSRNALLATLSGGMKRRVSLAVSLFHQPELLILDEPTVGVDPEIRAAFWGYFERLKAFIVSGATEPPKGLGEEEGQAFLEIAQQVKAMTSERVKVSRILVRFSAAASSREKKRALAVGARIITLHHLHDTVMNKIDAHSSSFWSAAHGEDKSLTGIGLLERQRIRVWMKKVYEEFDRLSL